MKYNKEEVKKIFKELINKKDIEIEEIPCIDLYMDQVTTFFEDKLCNLKRNEEDKILTKTMINNYTKGKILMPAKKKKYTLEHMIFLILIYNLKQGLSINDINTFFNPIFNDKVDEIKEDISIEKLYRVFLKIKNKESEDLENNFNFMMDTIEGEFVNFEGEERDLMELLTTVLVLINRSNSYKRMAEKVIDNFFKE
ncbi:hypothetical protein BD780_001407 [Clostridium tetanomorphum]|uniref:DUF1836 domain-containing protein n=1 Tax=Clostridium tetanomorphum TaxID=1553 RepID=A0A923J0J3_CLOTT|nr:DUF1836 domain-containing protein [Clostridium tetanomorphum]KAJ49872.1 hypothetical protein CTM_20816 [Clostridium tetanomorphum DSM 665]MBC2398142.1 DUF1836 domain-containing protein [Clostridium tetanomorphum]MBP1866491.1 hypothetical protein [Clostridium tetanomorphum]NRS84182.1 hypothetical protein [Clostridium tetanomorphum]NRZ97394.1 hypothetical protein [Clostridium tetanomorphum]